MNRPLRIHASPPSGALGAAITRRGGRIFRVCSGGSLSAGDGMVTLPGGPGALSILVPRGLGTAQLARKEGAGWRSLASGAPLGAARWAEAGPVAAWTREVSLPRGPERALGPVARSAGPAAGVLVLRPTNLAWAAARRADPSAGRGAVAVVDRWVRGVSPAASALGVARGMSAKLARRRAPGLRFVAAADLGPTWQELLVAVAADLPGAARVGSLIVAPLPALSRPEALALAEHVARRAWQAAGVACAAAVAPTEADAAALARCLDPSVVAVVPPSAAGAWACARVRGSAQLGARAWRGPALPDSDGACALAAAVLDGLRARAPVDADSRLELRDERGWHAVDIAASLPAAAVEHRVHDACLHLGAVDAIRAKVVARATTPDPRRLRARQLPLLLSNAEAPR